MMKETQKLIGKEGKVRMKIGLVMKDEKYRKRSR